MELKFRLRDDRPDKQGRVGIMADLHWRGGQRLNGLSTGIRIEPGNWQPGKTKWINTREDNATQKNIDFNRFGAALRKVFDDAAAAGRHEADVTPDELRAAVAPFRRTTAKAPAAAAAEQPAAPSGFLSPTAPWQQYYDRWHAENVHAQTPDSLRLYKQVVSALERHNEHLRLAGLDRATFAGYIQSLYDEGKKDSTVGRHYSFLRECHRLAGLPVPRWLEKFTAKYGRAASLRRAEFLGLVQAVDWPADLLQERDVFVFQSILLLRDRDLRDMQPHHVTRLDLPGYPDQLCALLYQQKTSEPVAIPLPPVAAEIWQRYAGRLPIPTQQERNRRIKMMGQAADLTREFVDVAFSGRKRHEQVLPLWKALTTHTARHTGSDLLVWASDGDQQLKECALGYVSASVYGYDNVMRYGPLLLKAWEKVLGTGAPLAAPKTANGFSLIPQRFVPSW